MDPKFKMPTESVELPSKGLLYPKDSTLATGKLEMKYMTAKEEDILTNQNYIEKGTVIDKLLQSLIVDKGVDYGNLLAGDKNAIMIAARVLAYGKDYTFEYKGQSETVDLSVLENKPVADELEKCEGKNEFTFNLPHTGNVVTFKLLTHNDDKAIEREIKGLKRLNKDASPTSTTRFKHMITSVNGMSEPKDVREFVENFLLAKDGRALREEYSRLNPDIDTTVEVNGKEDVALPITLNFFWPDLQL
jgi:hypothetical protein|tara:strand:+ start:43 stop:783 length:741 start_codon:yes stop_codon:yes gene_type:complete